MLTAPHRPDILAEILCPAEEKENPCGQQEELASILSFLAAPAEKRRTNNGPAVKNGRLKKKVTVYFSREKLEGLEKVKRELQLLFPGTKKTTFSRSNLLETTVALLLKEFADKKTHKELLGELFNEG